MAPLVWPKEEKLVLGIDHLPHLQPFAQSAALRQLRSGHRQPLQYLHQRGLYQLKESAPLDHHHHRPHQHQFRIRLQKLCWHQER